MDGVSYWAHEWNRLAYVVGAFYFKTLWFEAVDEECLGFLVQRKQVRMQWAQDPNQSNVDNLKNVRNEASRHIREKKGIAESPNR